MNYELPIELMWKRNYCDELCVAWAYKLETPKYSGAMNFAYQISNFHDSEEFP